jgi:alkylhydroperoxidase family enzyme
MSATGFLTIPEPTAEAQRLFDADLADVGYIMNASRMWAYQPATLDCLFDLMRAVASACGIDLRQRGILVTAAASALGDSYGSLAWGQRLAAATDAEPAAGVLRGDDGRLTASERAMAHWARRVARDPNRTRAADAQALRDAGFDDNQIFAITVFVALRIAFSTVNDALGARPAAAFRSTAPADVLDAVTYGRPIEDAEPYDNLNPPVRPLAANSVSCSARSSMSVLICSSVRRTCSAGWVCSWWAGRGRGCVRPGFRRSSGTRRRGLRLLPVLPRSGRVRRRRRAVVVLSVRV